MIRSFQHNGLELFFTTGRKSGIRPDHEKKLQLLLTALNAAESPEDLSAPAGWRMHQLTGNRSGYWSLTVNGNWRLVFRFIDNDVELVDYLDYH